MRVDDLPVVILQQIGAVAVQNAGCATSQRCRVKAGRNALAGRLDAVDRHFLVIEERVEQPHGVRSAAYTGDDAVGKASLGIDDLLARFLADDRLEVTYHLRVGVRAGDSADDVEMGLGIRHPVAQRLVHRVLQRAGSGRHRMDLRAEKAHPVDIRLLPADVLLAHEDLALHVEQGAGRGGGDAVLTGACLGNDLGLSHALGEKRLSQHIVDLVRAGVVQLVTLQIQLRAAIMRGQTLGEIERARPADIMRLVIEKLPGEVVTRAGRLVGAFHLQDQRHQGFGDKPPAMHAETAALVGLVAKGIEVHVGHGSSRLCRWDHQAGITR